MQRARLFAALIASVILVLAQAPIGIGPLGLIQQYDWYSGTPSGCVASAPFPAKMCVGGAAASRPQGDTYYWQGCRYSERLALFIDFQPLDGSRRSSG